MAPITRSHQRLSLEGSGVPMWAATWSSYHVPLLDTPSSQASVTNDGSNRLNVRPGVSACGPGVLPVGRAESICSATSAEKLVMRRPTETTRLIPQTAHDLDVFEDGAGWIQDHRSLWRHTDMRLRERWEAREGSSGGDGVFGDLN